MFQIIKVNFVKLNQIYFQMQFQIQFQMQIKLIILLFEILINAIKFRAQQLCFLKTQFLFFMLFKNSFYVFYAF